MRGIIHIGTEKTGTTSFQSFMAKNRDKLRREGILYPRILGADTHRMFATYCLSMDEFDDSFRFFKIENDQELNFFYEKVEVELCREVSALKDQSVCIISSEHLHSRLRTIDQIKRLKTLLTRFFDEIEIHIHLRPQVDLIVSLASTQTRVGATVRRAFFEKATLQKPYFNYDTLVGLWEQAFGAQTVHCLPFKVEPDFLSYIFKKLSVDLSVFDPPDRVNEAIDVRVMAMMNSLIDSGSKTRIDFRVIDRLPVYEKLKISNSFARQIQNKFEEGNRNLIGRRPDLVPGCLQPRWQNYPETGNMEVLEIRCEFANMLASLIDLYNIEIADVAENKFKRQ